MSYRYNNETVFSIFDQPQSYMKSILIYREHLLTTSILTGTTIRMQAARKIGFTIQISPILYKFLGKNIENLIYGRSMYDIKVTVRNFNHFPGSKWGYNSV